MKALKLIRVCYTIKNESEQTLPYVRIVQIQNMYVTVCTEFVLWVGLECD